MLLGCALKPKNWSLASQSRRHNLGSIQPGKLADLAVLDRVYPTIPAEQIKDIKPTMTIVGGRIVFDAAPKSSAPR
jgi:predicted amidohydrolase YtcJ